jgi:HEAT repeat protein
VKKRRLMLVLAGVLAVVIAFVVWPGEREPEYQGKKLSEWLRRHQKRENPDEAANAVRQISTNALSFLLAWLEVDDLRPWKMSLLRRVSAYPRIHNSRLFLKVLRISDSDHNRINALHGFEILGPDAREAIPALKRMMNDATPDGGGHLATVALSYIGKDALPVLLSALSDEAQTNRSRIAMCIGAYMRDLGRDADPAAPMLIKLTKGPDKDLATAATRALGDLRASPELAVPALREALHDSDPFLPSAAVVALGKYGEGARSDIPELLELLNASNFAVRSFATTALNKIQGKPLNEPE